MSVVADAESETQVQVRSVSESEMVDHITRRVFELAGIPSSTTTDCSLCAWELRTELGPDSDSWNIKMFVSKDRIFLIPRSSNEGDDNQWESSSEPKYFDEIAEKVISLYSTLEKTYAEVQARLAVNESTQA